MDRNEYLHKVLDVILHINEGAVTRKGEGHPTAFFNFSGHTAMLSIQVNKNGWSNERPSAEFDKYIFMDHCSDDELSDFLKEIRALAFSLKFPRRKEA